MKVYIDLVFLLNFFYDLILLMIVKNILKRRTKISKLIIASLVGVLSILLLFIKIPKIISFALKIITSILMVIISFNYVSLRYTLNNLSYLYMSSIILAGFLYFLDINFSYDHKGLIFIFKGISVNYILLIIISPIVLLWYVLLNKKMKCRFNNYYQIDICFEKHHIKCIALFDSGNNLIDPITSKPIIILNSNLLKDIYNIRSPIYVPYVTVSGSSMMRCYKPSYILINNHKIYNYLIGETNNNFSDGIKCLLNNKLMEDNYV